MYKSTYHGRFPLVLFYSIWLWLAGWSWLPGKHKIVCMNCEWACGFIRYDRIGCQILCSLILRGIVAFIKKKTIACCYSQEINYPTLFIFNLFPLWPFIKDGLCKMLYSTKTSLAISDGHRRCRFSANCLNYHRLPLPSIQNCVFKNKCIFHVKVVEIQSRRTLC